MPRFRPNEDSGEDGRRALRQRLEEAPRESSAGAAAKLFGVFRGDHQRHDWEPARRTEATLRGQ